MNKIKVMEGQIITVWNVFCLVMVILYVRYDVKRNENERINNEE
jgi:hypothetical protein